EDGGTVVQETRLFDPARGETRAMRTKEEAHDYRYFPDPDLLPLVVPQVWVDEIAESLPELPDEKKARFMADLGLNGEDAAVLVAEKETADYFEAMIAEGAEPKSAANWLINEYFGRLNREGIEITDGPVPAAANSAIVQMVAAGDISGKIAKEVLDIVWAEGGDPRQIVEQRGMRQVSDTGEIERVVDEIIAANPEQAAGVKEKPKALGWFV